MEWREAAERESQGGSINGILKRLASPRTGRGIVRQPGYAGTGAGAGGPAALHYSPKIKTETIAVAVTFPLSAATSHKYY